MIPLKIGSVIEIITDKNTFFIVLVIELSMYSKSASEFDQSSKLKICAQIDGLLAIGLMIVTCFVHHCTYHYVPETDLKLLQKLQVYIRNVPGAMMILTDLFVY